MLDDIAFIPPATDEFVDLEGVSYQVMWMGSPDNLKRALVEV